MLGKNDLSFQSGKLDRELAVQALRIGVYHGSLYILDSDRENNQIELRLGWY